MTRMMTLEEAMNRVSKAMDLLEGIPDDLYPMVDEEITKAFNLLDDVHSSLKPAVDYQKEFEAEHDTNDDA